VVSIDTENIISQSFKQASKQVSKKIINQSFILIHEAPRSWRDPKGQNINKQSNTKKLKLI